MKRADVVVRVILFSTILGLAGCATGPCVGYGCPAFAQAAQAPQLTGAGSHRASTSKQNAQAANRAAIPLRADDAGQ